MEPKSQESLSPQTSSHGIAHYTKRLYTYLGAMVHKPYATPVLSLLFYLEAIFFLPVDPILFVYCIEKRRKALWYAAVATFSSVAGGVTSYLLGMYLWNTVGSCIIHHRLVTCLLTPEQFASLAANYKQNGFLAILLVGLTPFPFKALTLSAGFCQIPFVSFVLCATIVRGVRFFGYALATLFLGHYLQKVSHKTLIKYACIVGCIVAGIIMIIRYTIFS